MAERSVRFFPTHPNWIDVTNLHSGEIRRGIFEQDGDTLTIRTAGLDKTRPSSIGEFRNGDERLVLRRKK